MSRYGTRRKASKITTVEMSEESSSSSEEEDVDSSDDFVVSEKKIKNTSFFSRKSLNKESSSSEEDDDDDDDDYDEGEDNNEDDDDFEDVNTPESLNMFSEVLKNLAQTKSQCNTISEIPSSSGTDDKADANTSTTKEQKTSISKNEITELLLQGETGLSSNALPVHSDPEDHETQDKEEEEDIKPPTDGYTIPKEGVKIVLPGANLLFNNKTKKKHQDLETILKNKLNSKLRANQVLMHKVGLLCWLHYGFRLNQQLNDANIMSNVLTLISNKNYPEGRADLKYLEKFTKWFRKSFQMEARKEDEKGETNITKEVLLLRLKEKKIYNYKELVLLYIALLRAMGLKCRLVISLYPPRLKVRKDDLFKTKAEQEQSATADKTKIKTEDGSKKKQTPKAKKSNKKEEKDKKSVPVENSPAGVKNSNMEARAKAAAILREKFARIAANKPRASIRQESDEEEDDDDDKGIKTRNGGRMKRKGSPEEAPISNKKLRTSARRNKESENKDYAESDEETSSTRPSTSNRRSKKSKPDDYKEEEQSEEDSDDDEFVLKSLPKKRKSVNRKSTTTTATAKKPSNTRNRKLVSSDEEYGDEDNAEKIKNAQNMWAEVYVESEEQWICVCVIDEKIHCVPEIYKKALKPVLYVIAWNSEGSVKDVTRRYCPNWLTSTRKKRVEEKWWVESLTPWKEKDTAISRAEDEMLLQKELEQPLPKTVGECKGHPLYVLTRHLLKFEALYPSNAVPLGRLSTGEAIYSRHCVHTLRSRETWVRQARVVKPYEKGYKIVKSLPKYDKLSGMKIKDQPLELFGEWQTDPYVPPEAKDGIIPRNEYGNVDLFKESMLPKGTVHINLPGLNRIARKLNIDCAPACVGFNFGRMGALPAFEGYVVCQEYEDTLREAWEEEQIAAAKRQREKREKRVYGNWRRLIKGLFIRERLAAKYDWTNDDDEDYQNKDQDNVASAAQRMAKLNEKLEGAQSSSVTKKSNNNNPVKSKAVKKDPVKSNPKKNSSGNNNDSGAKENKKIKANKAADSKKATEEKKEQPPPSPPAVAAARQTRRSTRNVSKV